VIEFTELYEKLKKEKAELLEKLEQLRALGQPSAERKEGSPFGKREEEADEASELEKRLALEERLGESIEQARLEAIPQASLCLSCKAQQAKDTKGAR
jgi:RNA polymerase-binding transcription factor DksA